MRSLNESNKISNKKSKNSLNNDKIESVKKILKKSSRQTYQSVKNKDVSKLKKKNLREILGNEDLYFLSNANLNIINILNTRISKDYFNDSSFMVNNSKKSKNGGSYSKWKKPTWKTDKSKDSELKKKGIKTNICSKKAQIGSESINNKNIFFSSIESKSIISLSKFHLYFLNCNYLNYILYFEYLKK